MSGTRGKTRRHIALRGLPNLKMFSSETFHVPVNELRVVDLENNRQNNFCSLCPS